MKNFISLILSIAPFLVFSQGEKVTQISKSKLSEIKTLNAMLVDLSSDAQIISFEMASNIGSKSNTITGNGGQMDEKKINFLKSANAGSIVHIDIKSKDKDGRITAWSYKIKITK